MKHSIPLLIVSIMLMVGCKPKVPSEYIQPDDLEDILYEYHVAESMARNGNSMDADYNQTKYFLAVLEKHHVTEAVFDSSMTSCWKCNACKKSSDTAFLCYYNDGCSRNGNGYSSAGK